MNGNTVRFPVSCLANSRIASAGERAYRKSKWFTKEIPSWFRRRLWPRIRNNVRARVASVTTSLHRRKRSDTCAFTRAARCISSPASLSVPRLSFFSRSLLLSYSFTENHTPRVILLSAHESRPTVAVSRVFFSKGANKTWRAENVLPASRYLTTEKRRTNLIERQWNSLSNQRRNIVFLYFVFILHSYSTEENENDVKSGGTTGFIFYRGRIMFLSG